MTGATPFPESVRSQVATLHVEVVAALDDGALDDAKDKAREVLAVLRAFPLDSLPDPVLLEKAYAAYALGVVARERGSLSEAAHCLSRAAGMAPTSHADRFRDPVLYELAHLHEDLGRPRDAAAVYDGLLASAGLSDAHRGLVCYRCGRALEQAYEYVQAAQRYSVAVEYAASGQVRSVHGWVPDAYAGITRCTGRREVLQGGFSFGWWFRGGWTRVTAFAALAMLSAALFVTAIDSVRQQMHDDAKWWLISCALPLGLLVLPGLRRFSLKDGMIEAAGVLVEGSGPSVTPPE